MMMSESFGIATSAMLIELSISCWTARKLDKRVSQEVDVEKGAKARAGNYNKNLLAGTHKLDNIVKFAAGVRAWHNANTLPWSDNGLRLLPMDHFLAYKERLSDYEQEYNALVQDFLQSYPDLVSAAAFQLGNLFDRTEYPEAENIAHKFRFNYVFSPVPSAGDFRIDINEQAKAELTENFNQHFDARVKGAMKEAWSRLHDCLTHMSERLEDAGEAERKVFRDSLVGNAVELVDMLKVLNVTKDPDLERARQQLPQTITGVEAKDLRESAEIRKDVRAQVTDILNKFNW
jgi:hypothetical protein